MTKAETKAAIAEFVTVRDLLRWALTQFNKTLLFYGHGTDNAWDEAVYLISSGLNLPPDMNANLLDAKLLEDERRHLIELIEKRATQRIPVAYLTKQAWFAGLPFYVDERVIIPRSPIAEIIEKGYSPWVNIAQVERALDLCTGSGCIAITSAVNFPNVQIDAIDISSEALEVAKINLERHQVAEQIRLIQSDLFERIPNQMYDLIVSNPPYVAEEEYLKLPNEFHYEPQLALEAKKKGLDIILRILQEAGKYLTPEGILIVEVGNSAQTLMEKFPEVPFVWLEFERGHSEVFLLTAEQLEIHQDILKR